MINTTVYQEHWGRHKGCDIFLFKIEQENGSYVEVTNYGATLVSVVVPDASGQFKNVILGFDNLQGYLDDECYIGATVGRVANRISNGRFKIKDSSFLLEANDGLHSNHGGTTGFNTRVFDFDISGGTVLFELFSEDGDGGYPGNLSAKVKYDFTSIDELRIDFEAYTDMETPVNFTNHAYFNLSGRSQGIFDHDLYIPSNMVLEMDDEHIPTGKISPAELIAFKGQAIQSVLEESGLEGLNVFYVLDYEIQQKCPIRLNHALSGRCLEVTTSYPGVMLYSGHYLKGQHSGHSGIRYRPFDGLCLECQGFPDSPNHENFPPVMLYPDEKYEQFINLKFITLKSDDDQRKCFI